MKSKFDEGTIERALTRLLDDGTIYTAHSNETYILDAWARAINVSLIVIKIIIF